MSARRSASSASSVMRSFSAFSADKTLPEALILGDREKATDEAVSSLSANPLLRLNARMPGRSELFITLRPLDTRSLFSPLSGTISATVPITARSPKSSNTESESPSSSALINLNATPTPARSVHEQLSSVLCGSTTASASGRTSPG